MLLWRYAQWLMLQQQASAKVAYKSLLRRLVVHRTLAVTANDYPVN